MGGEGFVEFTDGMKGPEGTEFSGGVFIFVEDFFESVGCVAVQLSLGGTFLKEAPGMADEPVVFVEVEVDQFGVGEGSEIDVLGFGIFVGDFEDPAIGPVPAPGIWESAPGAAAIPACARFSSP